MNAVKELKNLQWLLKLVGSVTYKLTGVGYNNILYLTIMDVM